MKVIDNNTIQFTSDELQALEASLAVSIMVTGSQKELTKEQKEFQKLKKDMHEKIFKMI